MSRLRRSQNLRITHLTDLFALVPADLTTDNAPTYRDLWQNARLRAMPNGKYMINIGKLWEFASLPPTIIEMTLYGKSRRHSKLAFKLPTLFLSITYKVGLGFQHLTSRGRNIPTDDDLL